jgi:alkylation response protein AidB-like acyl-CoA dehydrogenase
MRQNGIEIRPIVQMTGGSEFNEVFFDGARTSADNVVGGVDGGWRVAMGTLAFERGASTLGQQLRFQAELDRVIELARANGSNEDPVVRQRLADAWIGVRLMRFNALRTLSAMTGAELPREALITKLVWSTWHRGLGELAMEIAGMAGTLHEPSPELAAMQRAFLISRAGTIYAGSSEIQRNIIGERALGLPPEPKAT